MDIRQINYVGLEAFNKIRCFYPAVIILMTAYSSIESAVEGLKIGAYDYLTKPIGFDVLRSTLNTALKSDAGFVRFYN